MKYLILSLALLVTASCSKSDDKPAEPKKTAAPAAPDYVRVLASHAEPKPSDPVVVEIPGFRVTKAAFDPAQVEGGTATVELDLASIASGSPKRDNHLKTADYLDVDKFAVATIDIANVKKTSADHYTADAKVSIHGVEQTLPVTFEVLETLPDGIRIRGEHEFSRHDFQIGAAAGEDSVGETQKIELQLTLRNT